MDRLRGSVRSPIRCGGAFVCLSTTSRIATVVVQNYKGASATPHVVGVAIENEGKIAGSRGNGFSRADNLPASTPRGIQGDESLETGTSACDERREKQ
mmetsp:Transcript_106759/g.217797  ORF Transcript_106759/g.217797 Transcript_106759/m.217797 type:complete len:98 (-) Transcript_106759:3272-3565(-)